MSHMNKERAIELFPYLDKFDKNEITTLFMDITKLLLLPQNEGDENFINALIAVMRSRRES